MRKRIKNNIRIAVDIDETIISSFSGVLNILAKKSPHNIDYNDLIDHEWHKIENIPWTQAETDKAWEEAHRNFESFNQSTPLIDGAKEGLIKLKSAGYSIVAITGRSASGRKATKDLLEKYFPGIFSWVYFGEYHSVRARSKGEIGQEHRIDFAIDDNLTFAESLAKAGIPTYLLPRPWNSYQNLEHTNLIRMNTWEEISEDIIRRVELQKNTKNTSGNISLETIHIHTLMNPQTNKAIITQSNEEHHLIVQEPHELMVIEHNLPTLQPEHQELVNTEHHAALENISNHTALVKKARSRGLATKSADTSLVKQDV
ncbi:MAG: hypothetical protein U0518_01740 [Candidatus Gracilibacteria bacterium]